MTNSVINPGDLPLVIRTRGISIVGTVKKYETYEEMIRDSMKGNYAWVEDATGDPTVSMGSAFYKIEDNGFIKKLMETEAMDTENFGDGHIHDNLEVLTKFSMGADNKLLFNNLPIGETKDYDDDIATINGNIQNISTAITTIQGDITNLQTTVGNHDIAIGTFSSKFITLENNVNGVSNQLTITNTNVTNLGTELNTLNGTVNTLDSSLNALQLQVNGISDKADANETNISTLFGNISDIDESISLLQIKDGQLSDSINTVGDKVDTLNDKVTPIKNDVDSLKPRVTTLAADMIGVKQHVTESEETLDSHQTSIEQHTSDISGLTSRMEAVEATLNECIQELDNINSMV